MAKVSLDRRSESPVFELSDGSILRVPTHQDSLSYRGITYSPIQKRGPSVRFDSVELRDIPYSHEDGSDSESSASSHADASLITTIDWGTLSSVVQPIDDFELSRVSRPKFVESVGPLSLLEDDQGGEEESEVCCSTKAQSKAFSTSSYQSRGRNLVKRLRRVGHRHQARTSKQR